jgi:hypothetical protein
MSTDVLLKSMTRKYYGKSLMLGANARLAEWLNVAEERSSSSSRERLLWRKQTLKLDESVAIYDP